MSWLVSVRLDSINRRFAISSLVGGVCYRNLILSVDNFKAGLLSVPGS